MVLNGFGSVLANLTPNAWYIVEGIEERVPSTVYKKKNFYLLGFMENKEFYNLWSIKRKNGNSYSNYSENKTIKKNYN